jgi:hypothetical protein
MTGLDGQVVMEMLKTHFEQVPIEVVKEAVEREAKRKAKSDDVVVEASTRRLGRHDVRSLHRKESKNGTGRKS